jgi:hypothetical protein
MTAIDKFIDEVTDKLRKTGWTVSANGKKELKQVLSPYFSEGMLDVEHRLDALVDRLEKSLTPVK